jgi:hypothetical protein
MLPTMNVGVWYIVADATMLQTDVGLYGCRKLAGCESGVLDTLSYPSYGVKRQSY